MQHEDGTMFGCLPDWRRFHGHLLGSLAVPGLLAITAEILERTNGSEPAPLSPPAVVTPVVPAGVPVLDLKSCKALALVRQPAIAAAQASLSAAAARQHALDTIHIPRFLARDLPTRRQQAAVGISIAQAEVQRVQIDTLYSVTFSYLSAQYALEQRQLLDSSRERLDKLMEGVQAGLKAGKTNIRKEDEQRVESYLLVVKSKREEAIQGEQRALSSLREAIGADPHAPLMLTAIGQPRVRPLVAKNVVICQALTLRPEILQSSLLAQVHSLEVEAQNVHKLIPQSQTFAAGSDIHVRPLPAGSYNEQYSPAAVGPEMPANLAGKKCSRVEIAEIYAQRAGTVAEKTRNLLRLETEQAYLRYVETSNRLPSLIEAADKAQEVFDAVDASFQKGERATTVRDWLTAGSLVTELRAQVNTTRYQMLVALAGLERATAGAFCAGFETAPTTDPEKIGKKEKEEEKEKNDKDKDDK
jgi:outer membrane protein TolC